MILRSIFSRRVVGYIYLCYIYLSLYQVIVTETGIYNLLTSIVIVEPRKWASVNTFSLSRNTLTITSALIECDRLSRCVWVFFWGYMLFFAGFLCFCFFGNCRNWKVLWDSAHHTACGLMTTFAWFGCFLFEEEVTSFQKCLNDRSNWQSLISPQRKTLPVFCVKMPEWSESPCWITCALCLVTEEHLNAVIYCLRDWATSFPVINISCNHIILQLPGSQPCVAGLWKLKTFFGNVCVLRRYMCILHCLTVRRRGRKECALSSIYFVSKTWT